ncbi:MAG: AraC family transcriptional regulator, partial [Acidobacteria bacterium]|nr:AraC family transcriptional regulator [Acidobacteriota bacterium]
MAVQLPSQTARLGSRSFIIHERGSRHHWQGLGCLSIKTFSGGRVFYEAGNGRYAVDESSYLILNQGQTYSVSVESDTRLESFCIFFEDGLAQEVEGSLTARPDRLLDDPEGRPDSPTGFFERTYPHDEVLSPAVFRLRDSLARRKQEPGWPDWLDERLREVMEHLLEVHRRVRAEVGAFPALRSATREERYRRLYRARDFAAASFERPLTLKEMARVACLSPNHFLRTFKQIFHLTPHQYLTQLRLEQARKLLTRSDLPVTDIC